MIAPTDIRAFLGELFGAFPDLRYELLEVTAADGHAAVRWRARGTFAGPGAFQGFVANEPAAVWAGHADPVTGDVGAQLRRAADAPT